MLSACALSAVIVAALWQSSAEGGTVGGFVSYVTAMLMLITPLKHLSEVAGPMTRGLAAVQRGLELILDAPAENGGRHVAHRARGQPAVARGDAAVSRRPVARARTTLDSRFAPAKWSRWWVRRAPASRRFVNLLPRFLDPTGGSISLDQVPLAQWDLHTLRKQFALVSQDVVLFNDSVAANVALGADRDLQRVRDALKAANLLQFVESLPGGIEHPVGHNGTQLSGGQRQRLAIARAVYKDAPILILDEATSALDSESERLIQSALDRLMAGRTSIVIAHRLSTIEAAHRVIVLNQGRLVEQGTHAELLAMGGLFARLHALQFKV